ncbi:MAG: lytic transglycosylase domain-containing protein [Limnohabitans sp.]
MKYVLMLCLGCIGTYSHSHCFTEAAKRYNVPQALLVAIAKHESGGRTTAINHNRNDTRDIGLMQINSAWLPFLARHGLKEQDLFDPCVNVLIGAWILSNNFVRLGYNTQGLGAYNAATPWKRERYARQILQTFKY